MAIEPRAISSYLPRGILISLAIARQHDADCVATFKKMVRK
jgi:hypothetical protein